MREFKFSLIVILFFSFTEAKSGSASPFPLMVRGIDVTTWTGKEIVHVEDLDSALSQGGNLDASLNSNKSIEAWSAFVTKDSVAQFLVLTDVIDAGTSHARTKIIQAIAMPLAKVPLAQSRMLYLGDACHRKNSNLGVAALVRGWGPKYKVFKAWQADDAGNKLVEVPVAEVTCVEEGP